MPVDLSRYVKELGEVVKDRGVLEAAAEAMAEEMKTATARYIGGDLRMSNFRGAAVEFRTETRSGEVTVEIAGGTYGLADKGRRQARRAWARRGSALATPWGPRASVRGSTTTGFNITDKHSDDAFDAGIRAVVAELDRMTF